MPDFGIIDTHVHLWDLSRLRYTWLDGNPTLDRTYLPADFWAAHGPVTVEQMVFIQAECLSSQAMDEARWATGLAEQEPRIGGIVPSAPLENGKAVEDTLAELARWPRVKGIRRLLSLESDAEFCLRPGFLAGLRLLPQLGLSFDVCIRYDQLAPAVRMVRACPDVQFILDHVGAPRVRDGAREPWASLIRTMAELPNVVCKMSGLVSFADMATQTRDDFRPYADQVLECFGFDRVLYASDWPVLAVGMPYPGWVETVEWFAEGCSDDERRKLFRDNARRVYRLGET